MFQHKQVHTALLKLLNGAIQDKRFEHDATLFGLDWIQYTVMQKQVLSATLFLIDETFCKDQRVIKTSGDLLEYLVT